MRLVIFTEPANMRLLVIDSARSLLEAVRHCVADVAGCSVTTAEDAEAGLRAARAIRPEMVLADHELKTREGHSLIPALRQLLPGATLVCLSLDEEGGRCRALWGRSANFCMLKPQLAEALPALLTEAVH